MKRFFKKKWKNMLLMILMVFLLFSTLYLTFAVILYKGIETKIRLVGCLTLFVASFLLLTLLVKFKKKLKVTVFLILSLISIGYGTGLSYGAYALTRVYSAIDKMSSEEAEEVYSTSIIVKKESTAKDIEDAKKGKVGMVNTDKDDYELYSLANLIIDKNGIDRKNVLYYEDAITLIKDVVDGKIGFAILPTNYAARYGEDSGIDDLENKTKIIYTKEDKQKVKLEEPVEKKSLNEPFTVLIMGVAPETKAQMTAPVKNLRAQGDALILATFNPTTTNVTILSIPRDTYMPISCNNNKSRKITDAGGLGGDSCIRNSIQNFFDIKIDYYIKVNFAAVVKLVDKLGGVEVDVPYAFCEQNSMRKWGKNTVFVKAGKQTLNGEQALAFARHRKVTQYMVNYCGKTYTQHGSYWNDFVRGQNQQAIIKGLLKKFKDIDSFSQVMDILDILGDNIYTNFPTDNLSELYKMGKNILKKSASADEAFNMQRLKLTGYNAMIRFGNLILYNYPIYDSSKTAVIQAMKQNLGIASLTPVKTFNFNIKNTYTEPVIGNTTGSKTIKLMPDFVSEKRTIDYVRSWASANNIALVENSIEGSYGSVLGRVTKQSIGERTDLDNLKGSERTLTITYIGSVQAPTPSEPETPTDPDTGSTGDGETDTGDSNSNAASSSNSQVAESDGN